MREGGSAKLAKFLLMRWTRAGKRYRAALTREKHREGNEKGSSTVNLRASEVFVGVPIRGHPFQYLGTP